MDSLLLGRDRELVVIDDAIARIVRGERSLVMLTGEPGIGKSRLLDELAQRVTARGGAVAWGRSLEVGLTPAYWPWIEALAALEVGDDRAPTLGSVDRQTASARLAQYVAVAAFLARRAAVAPVALVFDDVHAADRSSLQLLEHLAPRARVLFAIAARDGDADREVATALGRIQRGANRLPLGRLDRGHVEQLVAGRANPQRVWELSEGNPLFVEELVATGEPKLPAVSSVRAVIRDRIARLPAETGDALVAAAVVGRDFRGQVVGDMLGRELDLAPALRVGMVAMTSPDRFRFSHALVAEALADELDPSERARYHLRAAQAIERREGSDDGAAAIAHHLLAAGNLAAEAAVTAAERAAAAAMSQLAFEDAAAMLDRAIAALGLAAPDDRKRRATILCAQAEALQHAAQHARANALCDSAAAIARSLGDGELLARIAHVRGLEWRFGRTDPLLVDLLREALALRPDDAKLLARLAAAEQPATDPRGPIERAFAAIELAKQLPPRDRLDVMYVAIAALIDYVDPRTLAPILEEVAGLARGVDRSLMVHTRLRQCVVALDGIDRGAFEAALQAFTADAETLGLPQWMRYTHMLGAMAAVLDGRFDDAEALIGEAEACTATLGVTNAQWIIAIHRAMTAAIRTMPLDDALAAALGTHPAHPAATALWVCYMRRDVDGMRAALPGVSDLVTLDPLLGAMVASAVAALGDRERAARLYAELAPRSGRIVTATVVGCNVFDLDDRVLLILATAAGRFDVVDEHAERALAIAARLGSPVWAARVRADWADACAARGDQARARELRALALADAERLGMPGIVERCRGVTPAPPRKAETVTIARAGELWLVRGFGEAVHIKDSRGMQMLARLVAEPGRELHVLDLGGGGDGVDGGDSGELLDPRARSEYRERLAELVAERDQAEAWGDRGRTERAGEEIEALTAELSRAVGLGGRERKAGAAAERARTNVQRRVNHALQAVRAASPRIAEHLTATIRTGTYCSYDA